VNVAADYAVYLFTVASFHDGVFKVGDVLHGAVGGGFGRGGQRPIGLVQPAADAVEGSVEGQEAA
jgi:hypothetical protein